MQRVSKVLLVSFCVAVMSLVVAQTPTVLVVGTVLNEATGLPIAGLSVYLIDAEGQRLPSDETTEQNVTDLEGRFTIANVTPDTWYGIEIYLNDTLRFTDYIFLDGNSFLLNSEGTEAVGSLAPIHLMLQRN